MSIDLLSESDWALQRGVSVRTIQRERAQRIGPPFIRLGKQVFYRPAAIEAWLLALEQEQPRAGQRNRGHEAA